VLGKRGFRRVHLVEAEREIGGTARWIPRLPGLGEWGRILDWRRVQLDRLRNVEVLTGLELAAGDVLDYGAELVVAATGSRWATNGLNGIANGVIPGADASQLWQLTPDQVMEEGKRPPGTRVLVYDTEGYFMAASLAELLAGEGHHVTLVTPYLQAALLCNETLEGFRLRQRLHDVGVSMRTGTIVTALEAGRALLQSEFGTIDALETDGVVLVTQRLSNERLYLELAAQPPERLREAGIEAVYRVGDCVAPRLLGDSIYDGHRLAREIDSHDPAVPLPYRREFPLVATPFEAAV